MSHCEMTVFWLQQWRCRDKASENEFMENSSSQMEWQLQAENLFLIDTRSKLSGLGVQLSGLISCTTKQKEKKPHKTIDNEKHILINHTKKEIELTL